MVFVKFFVLFFLSRVVALRCIVALCIVLSRPVLCCVVLCCVVLCYVQSSCVVLSHIVFFFGLKLCYLSCVVLYETDFYSLLHPLALALTCSESIMSDSDEDRRKRYMLICLTFVMWVKAFWHFLMVLILHFSRGFLTGVAPTRAEGIEIEIEIEKEIGPYYRLTLPVLLPPAILTIPCNLILPHRTTLMPILLHRTMLLLCCHCPGSEMISPSQS